MKTPSTLPRLFALALAFAASAFAAPVVTSLNVAAGSSYGGRNVVITGSGFTGATSVDFGGLPVRSGQFTVNSDTQITVSATPSNYGTVATVDLSVTAASGTGTKPAAYSYIAPTAPTTWDGNYPLRSTPSGWEGSVDSYGAVPLSATVNGSNQLVFTLHRRTDNGGASYYQIYRKLRDAYSIDASAWGGMLVQTAAGASSWTDTTAVAGTAYEYKFVLKNHGLPVASSTNSVALVGTTSPDPVGFIIAGVGVDMTGSRGRVVVIIADDVRTTYPTEYARYLADLVADGWTPHEVQVPRAANRYGTGNLHQPIRTSVKAIHTTYPDEVKHVVVLGSVPVPRTGLVNHPIGADGHLEVAHYSTGFDGYYGEMNEDAKWTDTGNNTGQQNPTPGSTNIAGDGKFDQDFVGPGGSTTYADISKIELGWGRVDFQGTGADLASYKAYFDRLAAFRRADPSAYPGERSLLRGNAYAVTAEVMAGTIPALLGPGNFTLKSENLADFPGNADAAWKDAVYSSTTGPYLFYGHADGGPGGTKPHEAVFGTGMQSHWGMWSEDGHEDMARGLALQGRLLSYTWGMNANHFMYHRLGLGGDMGDVMRSTINNGRLGATLGLYPWATQYLLNENPPNYTWYSGTGGVYPSATGNMIWTHFGDPTLRLYPLKMPTGLVVANQSGAKLTWQASPESGLAGYHVYKSASASGPFTRVTTTPVAATTYTDTATTSGTWTYQVKAVKLVTTGGGTFYNPSLGISQTINLSATPAALAIATTSLPAAYWNSAYTTTLATSGGWPGAVWSIVSGTLPAGLTLAADGTLSGSTSLAGSYGVTLRATDGAGTTADKAFTLQVIGQQRLVLAPVADSIVIMSGAGQNWGGRNFLGVSRGYSVNTQYGLLRFDLSGIPSDTIVSATLRLTTAANGHNPAQNQQVAAYLLADAGDGWVEGDNAGWNEKDTTFGVDWNSRPADRAGVSPVIVTPSTTNPSALVPSGVSFDLDLTSLAQADVAGDAQRRFSLRLESPNSDSTINFGSREGPAGTAPQLILLVQSPNPQVNYSPAILAEAAANNGSITQVMTLNLVNDTFVADVVSAGRVTAGNVPAGLTPVFTRLSDSQLSLGFSGAASAHGNANDVANLSVTFANGSFTLNTAAAVTGSTVNNLGINFNDPSVTLTVNAGTGGTVAPSGAQSTYANDPVNITASANAGYGFVNWTLTSGTASIASATSPATTVTPSTNATVTANFALLPSLAISGSASEGSEGAGVITVNLSNAQFVTPLNPASWSLTNLPAGVTMGTITRISATSATIALAGNRTADYDANITNIGVSIAADQFTGTSVPQAASVSTGFSLVALDDPETIEIRDDGLIMEGAENGEVITVILSGGTFVSSPNAANWTLTNLPAGVSRGAITRVSANVARVTLSGNRTANYSSAITNVTLTVAAAEVTAGSTAMVAGSGVTLTPATASTASFQDGVSSYAGTADTYIQQDTGTINYGTAATLTLGSRSSKQRFGLLKFDLSSIASNAMVTAATLDFVTAGTTAGSVVLYNVTGSWGEATATYANFNSSGSNILGNGSATATNGSSVSIPLLTSGVSAAQGWIATPANNFGFLVKSAITTNNAYVRLHSSEATTVANRPRLTVNYELPTLAAAEIAVQGQGITIMSGDTTPSLADDTDFGATAQGVGVTRTFTVRNLGGAALSVTGVTVSGANAGDFSITAQPASSVAAAGSTTFQVQFAPTATGLRTATLTVANNDSNEATTTFAVQGTGSAPQAGALQLSAATASGTEGPGATVPVTIRRVGGTLGSVSIQYATANGTATAGSDYTAASGTLTWADGDGADQTLTISLLNDSTIESAETFTLNLSNATGGAVAGSPATSTVTITDDDGDADFILHFPFDAGNGTTIADAATAGSNYTTTGFSGMAWNASGIAGACYSPTSSFVPTNHATLPLLPTQPWSITLWIKSSDTANYQGLFNKGGFNQGAAQAAIYTRDAGKLSALVGNAEVTTANVVLNGSWHLVALVNENVSGTWKARLYVDGGATMTQVNSGTATTADPFYIGSCVGEWNGFSGGLIDDFRFYQRSLTSVEITSLYNSSAPAPPFSPPALPDLATFRSATGLAADGSQDLLTPAGDGVKSLLKYAFNMIGSGAGQGTTLATPNSAVLVPGGSAGLPFAEADGSGRLALTFIRRKASSNPGVSYAVEFSDALTSWGVNASATESTAPIDATFERVTVTDSAASASRFVRVKVTAP